MDPWKIFVPCLPISLGAFAGPKHRPIDTPAIQPLKQVLILAHNQGATRHVGVSTDIFAGRNHHLKTHQDKGGIRGVFWVNDGGQGRFLCAFKMMRKKSEWTRLVEKSSNGLWFYINPTWHQNTQKSIVDLFAPKKNEVLYSPCIYLREMLRGLFAFFLLHERGYIGMWFTPPRMNTQKMKANVIQVLHRLLRVSNIPNLVTANPRINF